MSRGAYFGEGYAGDYNREHLVSNSVVNDVVSTLAGEVGANPTVNENYNLVNNVSARNSAQSQEFAERQMEYQTMSDRYAMNWSAQEAAKTREWQENLANTAHQREVADLLAAGLNPILSANSGAAVPSGATGNAYTSSGAMGTVDATNTSVAASMLMQQINNAHALELTNKNIEAGLIQSDNALKGALANAGAVVAAAQEGREGAYERLEFESEIKKQLQSTEFDMLKYKLQNDFRTNPIGYTRNSASQIEDIGKETKRAGRSILTGIGNFMTEEAIPFIKNLAGYTNYKNGGSGRKMPVYYDHRFKETK